MALTEECSHTQCGYMVCASSEMTVWELSRSHFTDEETKGDVEEAWQGLSWIIPVLSFHMPKELCYCICHQCLTFEGEARREKF